MLTYYHMIFPTLNVKDADALSIASTTSQIQLSLIYRWYITYYHKRLFNGSWYVKPLLVTEFRGRRISIKKQNLSFNSQVAW